MRLTNLWEAKISHQECLRKETLQTQPIPAGLRTWLGTFDPQHSKIWTKSGRAQFCWSAIGHAALHDITSLCPTHLPPFKVSTGRRKTTLLCSQTRPQGSSMWPVQYWCLKEPNRRLLSNNLSLAPQPLNAQNIETTLPPEVHPRMLALQEFPHLLCSPSGHEHVCL